MGLTKLESYCIRAVWNLQPICFYVPDDRLVKRVHLSVGYQVIGELSSVAALPSLRKFWFRWFDFPAEVRVPFFLLPGGVSQCRDVGSEDACSPMDAHQARASVSECVSRITPHSARPELRDDHSRVVLQPGNGPLRPSLDTGEAGLDRCKSHVAVDTAYRHFLRQDIVEQSSVLWRSQDPAAGS
ncbi:hypothetical protein ES703_116496 [subsurface metagenome]